MKQFQVEALQKARTVKLPKNYYIGTTHLGKLVPQGLN